MKVTFENTTQDQLVLEAETLVESAQLSKLLLVHLRCRERVSVSGEEAIRVRIALSGVVVGPTEHEIIGNTLREVQALLRHVGSAEDIEHLRKQLVDWEDKL